MEATVLNISGAWLGISPQKNTRYVRLLCETEGGGKYYHDLWLTEKTEERSLKQLLEYGFTRELNDIGELDDGNEAKDMFIVPDGGVRVILKTEEYTAKGTGELKSVTKVDCTKAQQFKAKGVDKKHLHKFKSDDFKLRSLRAESKPQVVETQGETDEIPF